MLPFLFNSYSLDNDRTDDQPKSGYITKKDVRVIIAGISVLVLLLVPVYQMLLKRTQFHLCTQNFSAIGKAVALYTEDNDGRLPPLYDALSNGSPYIEEGLAYTWIGKVNRYKGDRQSFVCPSAAETENTHNIFVDAETGNTVDVPSSYGMYAAYSAYTVSLVAKPSQTVLIAETANMGALNSYDPQHYKDMKGETLPQDGFAIGWDTNNFVPAPGTTSVTRLAFYEGNNFSKDSSARHGDKINMLFVDGHVEQRSANVAGTLFSSGNLTDPWSIPPALGFGSK